MDPNTLINELLDRSRYIRAIGPTTDDFMRWRDAADELLTDLLDEDHPALAQYRTRQSARVSGSMPKDFRFTVRSAWLRAWKQPKPCCAA